MAIFNVINVLNAYTDVLIDASSIGAAAYFLSVITFYSAV